MAPPDDVPNLRIDLRDVEPAELEGFDAVIHLAALSNDPLGDLNPELTYDINLHASVRLATAAKEAGVPRFLFSSSCSLYGAGGDELLDETRGVQPGHALRRVEGPRRAGRVEAGRRQASRRSTCATPPRTASSRRLRADIVVNNLVGHAVTTGKVLLQSDGTPWRPLVHMRDISHALRACLVAPRMPSTTRRSTSGRTGENFQIRDIAKLVAEVVPGCEVAFAEGAAADARDYRVDFSKIERRLPGYQPAWTLRRGIEQLYGAYSAAGLTWEAFDGSRYHRLRTIQRRLQSHELDDALRWT